MAPAASPAGRRRWPGPVASSPACRAPRPSPRGRGVYSVLGSGGVIDVERRVGYWRGGAEEDWAVAIHLVERGSVRHGLFFAHLALEKLLKAHVCRRTGDVAPRLHNLVRLAEIAELALDSARTDTLAEMNAFSLAGRYPDASPPPPSLDEALLLMGRALEVLTWLTATL